MYNKKSAAYSQAIIGSILLSYYNRNMSPELLFGIGEGYAYYFDGEYFQNFDSNVVTNMCYNLSFFENHFISLEGKEFIKEVEDILHVKKYPIGIIFCKYNMDEHNFNYKEQKSLLLKKTGQNKRYVIWKGEEKEDNFDNKALMDYIGYQSVEWSVLIPPKRILNVDIVIRKAISGTINRMNHIEYRYLDSFIEKIKENADNNNIVYSKLIDGTVIRLFAGFLNIVSKRLKIPEFDYVAKLYYKVACLWDDLGQYLRHEISLEYSLLNRLQNIEAEALNRLNIIYDDFLKKDNFDGSRDD